MRGQRGQITRKEVGGITRKWRAGRRRKEGWSGTGREANKRGSQDKELKEHHWKRERKIQVLLGIGKYTLDSGGEMTRFTRIVEKGNKEIRYMKLKCENIRE